MQTVKSCCCGCTLKTGTLILLWLGAVLIALTIVGNIATAASQNVQFSYILLDVLIRAIILGIYVMGIYGVEKERPAFLTPYLALQVIGIVSIIISMVLVAIFGTAVLAVIAGSSQSQGKEAGAAATGIIVSAEIGCAVALGLAYYFFIVVLSFYKELRGEIPRQ